MIRLRAVIDLASDAEPGSGLGTETLNALLPRDEAGQPWVPASHLKGLLRERFEVIARPLGWGDSIEDRLFGREGRDGGDGVCGALQVSAARGPSAVATKVIVRTAVGALGTARANSLRATEALATGSQLQATLTVDGDEGGDLDLATRLCLRSLPALGGNRTRGAGGCKVTVLVEREGDWVEDPKLPGELLQALDAVVRSGPPPGRPESRSRSAARLAAGEPELMRLVFRAQSPVCCPESPVVGNNVLRSGFAIPSSAVQGALLTCLDAVDPALATACFGDSRFRAWPLLPAGEAGTKDVPSPARVALSHKMSKLAGQEGEHEFHDASIAPYDWRSVAAGSPLKGSDGVLLGYQDGSVSLWCAADMPRLVTAHGVHHDPSGTGQRNLFTVEAMAPLCWTGLVALPREAVAPLTDALRAHGLQLGKARTIRGHGTARLEAAADALSPVQLGDATGRVFVVQSPLVIPDDWPVIEAEAALKRLVESAGWGNVQIDAAWEGSRVVQTQAACGVRFGWNREGLGARVGEHRRLRARRVILPGSVVVLEAPLTDPRQRLQVGVGDGRDQGFGALLPHPGIASRRFRRAVEMPQVKSVNAAGKVGLELWNLARPRGGGPSPSQIGSVAARVASPEQALAYLAKQRSARPPRIWHAWEPVIAKVEALIKVNPPEAAKALRVWQDLAIAHRGSKASR